MQKGLKKYFWLFALPTLVAFGIAFLVPFIMGIYLSFTKFTTVTNATFIGLDNYKKVFSTPEFMNALIFTTKFVVVSVITVNVCAFALAYLLTRKLKGTNIFRTVFFMPNLIGGIVLGYIWLIIINGILNYFGVNLTIANASSTSFPLIKSATILTFLLEILAYFRVALAHGTTSFCTVSSIALIYLLNYFYFVVVVLSPECPLNVLVGANSPNLCPIISSVIYTGTCFLPS